jgi:hypothetical protein
MTGKQVVFMYKQCRTEQSALRQRELEQGLLQTMLKQQYEQILAGKKQVGLDTSLEESILLEIDRNETH